MRRLIQFSLGSGVMFLGLAGVGLGEAVREAPAKVVVSVEPLTQKKYTETIPGSKVSFDMVPIPGKKRRKYLEENVAAASIKLKPEEVAELEAAVPAEAVVGTRYAEASMKTIDH